MQTIPKDSRVAYFSMEYGLHEDFKIYSGGLGVLAGDYLKTAFEMNKPVVGIGILWQQGYTNQFIGPDGKPYDQFNENHYDFLQDTGVTVSVEIYNTPVFCKVWLVDKYRNAPLYLLDSAIPENKGQVVTRQLYGGACEDRIAQEIILGIGGIRALNALGLSVDIYHFNEGHAVLAGLELIRNYMHRHKVSFNQAWQAVRQKIVFTTHTPVVAGNESHDHHLLKTVGAYNGFSYEQMKQIGGDPFCMTVAGLHLSRTANAVAQLHRETARRMWKDIWQAAPIISITNGVHPGTWQDPDIPGAVHDSRFLWDRHQYNKKILLDEIEKQTGVVFDPEALLIGFARRAASYKRGDLIFRQLEVIEKYLKTRKLQLIFSGKAHPQDFYGKEIIASIYKIAKRFPRSVVFLQNYGMRIGALLTRGCDLWLNSPRRPLEASGTSGMKAAMNGVLNLSILDGWWPEGCQHGINGWQFGNAYEGPEQDLHDLTSLYQVLLGEVIPTYYWDHGKWVEMMKASVAMSQQFSSHRMLTEYYRMLYTDLAFRNNALVKA
ncbi:MAG: alpha-glucan family phosphorylase [Bacillota bacterium]